MDYTNDFFIQAQGVIERVFRSNRPAILAAHGKIEAEIKGDNTPVTQLDKDIEEELRAALLKFDSSIGLEGEEFGIEGSRETYWLIDPIDGTESFIRGLPFVRNMATLIDNGEPIFTVIYQPTMDQLFVAAKGEGTYKNGQKMQMVERPLKRSMVELHVPISKNGVAKMVAELQKSIFGYRISDFCYVAEGKVDALLVYGGGGGPWDYAPRALIIREAGGTVTNVGSDNYDFKINNMIASHPSIHDELQKIVTGALD